MLINKAGAMVLAAQSLTTLDYIWLVVKIVLFCLGGVLLLGLLLFLFVWFLCKIVDLEKPQDHDSKLYRTVLRIIIPIAMAILQMRVHTRGLEKTPKSGRFMLVCNHINDLDPVTLLRYFSKSQLAFITKRENMSMFVVGKMMHKILCQPIDRENDRSALKTILKCISLIKEDKVSIGVFPEGYTSKDGKLHPFRPGVFKIAQKTNVPIVVCTIQNTKMIFKNLAKLKKTDVELHLTDVIMPEEYKGMSTVEISDCVYERMIADLGEGFRA